MTRQGPRTAPNIPTPVPVDGSNTHSAIQGDFGTPFWPNRPPAPWRIHKLDGVWLIEKRQTAGWETWCRFDTSAEAFAAFAAGGAR